MKVEEILMVIIGILSLIILYKIINGSLIEGIEINKYTDLSGCDNSIKGKLKNTSKCDIFTHGGCKKCSEYANNGHLVWQYESKPNGGICTACESGDYESVDGILDGDRWRTGPLPGTQKCGKGCNSNTDCINVNNNCNTCKNNRCVTSECRISVPGKNCAKLNSEECKANKYWGRYHGANVKCLNGVFSDCTGATYPKRPCDGLCQCEEVIGTNNTR